MEHTPAWFLTILPFTLLTWNLYSVTLVLSLRPSDWFISNLITPNIIGWVVAGKVQWPIAELCPPHITVWSLQRAADRQAEGRVTRKAKASGRSSVGGFRCLSNNAVTHI